MTAYLMSWSSMNQSMTTMTTLHTDKKKDASCSDCVVFVILSDAVYKW